MKKIVCLCLAVLLVVASLSVFAACGEQYDETLKIYNWDDYIYDTDLEDFVEYYFAQTGKKLKIVYVTFDTNETMLSKVKNDNSAVDVICPSEYAIQQLIVANKLQKLNYFTDTDNQYANEGNIDADLIARIEECFGDIDLTDYIVPYMYGTLGIMYNKAYLTEEQVADAGWGLLWNKTSTGEIVSQDIEGKIFMKDSIRDSYAASVFYLKERNLLPTAYASYSAQQLINTVSTDLLAKSEQVLIEQKEHLLGYEVDLGKNDLIKGRALVGLSWSGDALYSIEEAEEKGVELGYYVPAVGGNIWFDAWVMTTVCQNERAAKMFIDWLNTPVVAMENMMEIGYTSAVKNSLLKSDEESLEVYYDVYEIDTDDSDAVAEANEYFFDDAARYPEITDVTLGVMKDFGTSNDSVVTMWGRVRSANFNTLALILVIVGILVVGGVVALIIVLRKGKGNKRVSVD